MSEDKTPRRRLAPPLKPMAEPRIDPPTDPKLETMLTDIMLILATEISRYKAKVMNRDQPLDGKEARIIRDYAETIKVLNKETRETAKTKDFTKMTDAEIAEQLLRLKPEK